MLRTSYPSHTYRCGESRAGRTSIARGAVVSKSSGTRANRRRRSDPTRDASAQLPYGARPFAIYLVAAVAVLGIAACTDDASLMEGQAPGQVFFLDFAGTPEAPSMSPIVAARRDGGRFAVAARSEPSSILIFDGQGRFDQAIGRRGMGPGELGRIGALAFDDADSLWVFQAGRTDLWSPELEFVRTIVINQPIQDVATDEVDGEGFIVSGGSGGESRGLPGSATTSASNDFRVKVRLLTRDGDLTPLERESGIQVADRMGSNDRLVAATDRGFWVAHFQEWDIRHLTFEGDTIFHLDEAPAWWEPFEDEEMERVIDTTPSILDIGVDAAGRLWILGGIPIPDRDALQQVRAGNASTGIVTEFVDHVVRVQEGDSVIFERRFDYLPLTFLTPQLASVASSAGDSVRISIHRLDEVR